MADSNITKRALANSLKELMMEQPFEKINVGQICERCHMNRKSFYYHFKDKYDLVNWIFDTEIIALLKDSSRDMQQDERWEFIERICDYFYENRSFYRKALQIKGQNSFSDHLREWCLPILQDRLVHLIGNDGADEFAINFFADACVSSIERWLLHRNCMSAEEFVGRLKHLIQSGVVAIYQEMDPSNTPQKAAGHQTGSTAELRGI